VIFTSALEHSPRNIHPSIYEGKEVELSGRIKDHPKYGLEIILEGPAQIRLLD
jgi:hypothetical protein|tara:strand:+ start:272 stop:430 length:159 start_codon:yes stop_codon:yes gene_type:complete